MDGMPHEVEILFGLKSGTIQNGNTHRLLCHGWFLDADPPEETLNLLQRKYGIDRGKFLKYWHNYQFKVFAMAEKYTGLLSDKARAFAGLIWDIHLLGDWTPDNLEVSRLLPIKRICEDIARNMSILLGGGRRTEYVCNKIIEFIVSRMYMPTRHIAREFIEWLTMQKFGTEIYMANKAALKGVWNRDIAMNINEANATKRIQKEIADIGAAREAKHLARDAKLKNKSVVPMPKEEVKPLSIVRDLKAQCKDAKLAKGVIPETMKPQKGYLVPISYNSGRKGYVLVLKSSAVRTGTEVAAKTGGAVIASGVAAGAVEGVCAFVISSGVAFTLYQYGAIDDEELKDEFAKTAISGAIVGTAVAVSVVLGASPFGPVVIAVGIGGYVVCDIAFELIKGQPFTCDDILGYMDEEFEHTMSFCTVGTEPIETFTDMNGADSFMDEPKVPTFTDFGSEQKSFVDFTD